MFKTLFLAGALSAAAMAAQTAHAADLLLASREAPTSVFVPTAGTDFADARQVQALYRTLAARARDACDSASPHRLAVVQSDAACAREALDRAVAALGKPPLTDLHEASLRGPIQLSRR